MDGENKGKPYEQMDDLGIFPHYFWVDTHLNMIDFQESMLLYKKVTNRGLTISDFKNKLLLFYRLWDVYVHL